MGEVNMQITLDNALRREVKAAAKARVFARLPYCAAIIAAYVLPTMILGMITSVPLDAGWQRMLSMFGVSIVCEILILGPIMLGVQYALLGVARDQPQSLGIVFSPLGDMRELLRGMRMMLCMVTRLMLLITVPTGIYLGSAYVFSRWIDDNGIDNPQLVITAVLVLLAVYSVLLLPVFGRMLSYTLGYAVLHDHPEMGVWRATAEGSRLMRGQRRGMIVFMLSFVPWFVGGLLTCGILSMYGSAYMSVSLFTLGDRLRAAQGSAAEHTGDTAP